jgi:hypothetical protein
MESHISGLKVYENSVNGALSYDENATFGAGLGGGGVLTGFSGRGSLIGGDVYLSNQRIMLRKEVIYGHFQPNEEPNRNIYGLHISAGYKVTGKSQLLFRYDRLDTADLIQDSNLFILGYNVWPTQAAKVQINYVLSADTMAFKNHQILVNLQFVF